MYHATGYRKRVAERRFLGRKARGVTIYGPLKRLSYLLLACAGFALGTSASQFSIGLIHSDTAAYVCLGLAATTIAALGTALALIARNLSELFRHWEDEGNELLTAETRTRTRAASEAAAALSPRVAQPAGEPTKVPGPPVEEGRSEQPSVEATTRPMGKRK